MQEKGETDARDPGHELDQVAPNMELGGSHPQATTHQEDGRGSQTAGDRTPNWRTSAQPASKRPSRTNTEVVKLTVDKWFVDKGFGFGKVQTGEVVFIHASVVHGAEVLAVGADARTQVVSDHAPAEGGIELERRGITERGRRRRTKRRRIEWRSKRDERRH